MTDLFALAPPLFGLDPFLHLGDQGRYRRASLLQVLPQLGRIQDFAQRIRRHHVLFTEQLDELVSLRIGKPGERFADHPEVVHLGCPFCPGRKPLHREALNFGSAACSTKSTLKTFVLKNGKPFLKAENPKYPDLIPSDELMIQGVFRALIRKTKD